MLKRDYDGQDCSVARTLELIGDRWTLLIIRDAFLGLRRFDEFQQKLGIARNVLTDRLNRLVDEGIFERVPYSERPQRFEYRLTRKGRELDVVLSSLRQWGNRHLAGEPPTVLRRRGDHRPVVVAHVPEGSDVLHPSELELVPRSGA